MNPQELITFAWKITNKMNRSGHIPSCVELEDVAQAAITAALRVQPRYSPKNGASLKTYLGHRIVGAIKDEVERHMRLEAAESLDDDDMGYVPFHLQTPEKYAIEYDASERLNLAVARLPERLRQVFDMRYHQYLLPSQIAVVMNVSASRVSQYHNQIVEHLQRQLIR